MKPKDLYLPCSWEERHPCLLDALLYVPAYYERHSEFSMPQLNELFGNENDVNLEYCSGNGQWIIERAMEEPDQNWVAVEIRIDRAKKIWAKAHNRNLKNLFVVFGEALTFSRYYLQSECISQIYVNFPDPWPKKKHAKHRLIQKPFIEEMARVCRSDGKLTLVTDDATYRDQMVEEVLGSQTWDPSFEHPYYVSEWPEFGTSYFYKLWKDLGRKIYYLDFQKGIKDGNKRREAATAASGS